MNKIKNFLKSAARKALLKEVPVPPDVEEIYRKLGREFLGERTFYFGPSRRRVVSLAMESAPGTAETVISLLQQEPQGTKILDFGCGQHRSEYLKRMGFIVHSCDILPLGIDNFTQIDPAAKRLPFQDKQFDVTVISEVVEHVWSPWELLEELIRVTRKSIIITTPNPVSLKSKEVFQKTNYFYWFEPENFSYHMTPVFFWQVEEFCKTHNLRLADTIANHSVFGLEDGNNKLGYAEALIYKVDLK